MKHGIWIDQLYAVLRREIRQKISYRMTILTSSVSVVAGLLAYGLLGNTSVVSVTTSTYGMSLASYLVSGVAFAPLITVGPSLFSGYTYPSQVEALMTTPTDFRRFLLLSSFLPILTSLASVFFAFAGGVLLFGLAYSYNALALSSVIVLGLAASIGLGLLGLSFQLVYKQTGILSSFLYVFTGIAGNMIVPTQVLPTIVQGLSLLTPQYYFFTGIRVALGSDVTSITNILIPFVIYAVALNAVGLMCLTRALKSLRRSGTHAWS